MLSRIHSFRFVALASVIVAAICAIAVPVMVSLAPDVALAQPVRRVEIYSEVADQASIADAAVGSNDVTVVAAMGDACYASLSVDVVDLGVGCAITAANVATVTLDNNTGGAVDLASATFRVFLFRSGN